MSSPGMSTPSQLSPFVQLRLGDQAPAIFIAHGLAGTVQFLELARNIDTEHAIYGIQAKGIDGLEPPYDAVGDMADYYLSALEQLNPHDPYILVGYSFGGLVALEMAQRLTAKGKRIALLVLLDTFPHPRFLPTPWRLRLFAKRMKVHAQHMRGVSPVGAFNYLMQGIMRRLHIAKALHETAIAEGANLSSKEAALLLVNQKAYFAYASYRPKYYPGKINFVATEEKTFFPGDPREIWARLSASFEVEVVPGNHLNIVTTEYQTLASVITRYVKAVPAVAAP
jgi:acetoacetyl-CoA synthetase